MGVLLSVLFCYGDLCHLATVSVETREGGRAPVEKKREGLQEERKQLKDYAQTYIHTSTDTHHNTCLCSMCEGEILGTIKPWRILSSEKRKSLIIVIRLTL